MQLPSSYVVLDTETTGLRADLGHRIMEIAIIRVDPNRNDVFHYYVNPDRDPDPCASAINHITPEMLEDSPHFVEIADALLDFVGERKIYAHKSSFDMDFVNRELRRVSRLMLPATQAVCTLELAKQRMPGLPGHKLPTIARALRIDYDKVHLHGALGDTKLLHQVLQRLPD